ncbi:calcitonin gene-related peptide type 1 receptor isoform X1 [Seriola aureovittata]|uniref:calcitonin gene-related peptide type 1 receptor isoform X1 n=2 Tax=Seriola aureovittata TaxID=2871759 RepID=UPI0024BE52A4|nr:calcitonin gene-related peptide type 1 receptor isoform X1 [Seriola aureovittata]
MKLVGSLWILWVLLMCRAAAGAEPISDPSLTPGQSMIEGQSQAVSQGQYKCLELSNKDHQEKRTGMFCGRMWDGLLCWSETPAGTSLTQNCPDHLDLDPTEKVTKYCDELGNWVETGSTCQSASKDKLGLFGHLHLDIGFPEVLHFLRDAAGELSTEATDINTERGGVTEKMILENEKKCLEKMKQDPTHDKSGLHCSRNWDGWLCWDDTPAGAYASQNCPNYFSDFDPTEKVTKYCGEDGQWFQHPETNRLWTNYTLCATTHERRQRKMKMLQNEYECLQKINRDPPLNKSGLYCSRNWDGWLCWDDTPAGTYASKICPDYFSDMDLTEKATKYCGEDGQWFRHPESNKTWTNYTLCAVNFREKAAAQLSGDTEVQPVNEATVSPTVNPEEQEIVRKKILDSQYKCFEKMNRDAPYNKSGLYCSRNWDGWLCWDDTPAGTYTSQNCPNYFVDFDPTEKATKYCGEDGQWFRHPDTNRTWSNYTLCNENTNAKLKSAYILFYMAIVGHALSIASLLISLAIFFYFRSLSCQRITLHKNLFCSYVLNSALTIIYLVAVVNNPDVVGRNPVGCKVLHFFHMYMLGCNYFWMLCEGIYLHTLIVVAVFAEEQHLHWYYLLGWGFPLVPASIHAVARKKYFDDNCWMSVETHLLYAVHGPIVAALLVNLFFLLNIIRVLVTKLRDTHRAESNMYMKAVRATLILVPLLGIQFVIFPWRPENRLAGEVYEYIMHILMHYQGLLVATIFCFFNGEVQAALKRQWMQYKTQLGQRRKDHCSMRSTSYTATSITEVPAFMYHHDCNSEHLNGRHTEDSELVALKAGETYA